MAPPLVGGIKGWAMRVLITGGAGFIGSHLTDALVAENNNVVVLDNLDDFYDPELKQRNLARWQDERRITVIKGDIRNGEHVHKAFDVLGQGGHVVHLAARAGVRPSVAQPVLYSSVNVTGTAHMLEMARHFNAKCFVFASSSSVYGSRSNAPFRESDPVDRPISPYAATKAAGELLCATFNHLYALPTVALRFFTVYGPRQRPDLAIAKFARLLMRGEEVPLWGDTGSARDYTFIDDTVRGIISALRTAWPTFEVINLGGSHPVRLDELLRELERATGRTARRKQMEGQAGDVPLTCAATEKAERLLQWKAQIDFSTGIRRYVEWLNGAEGQAFLR